MTLALVFGVFFTNVLSNSSQEMKLQYAYDTTLEFLLETIMSQYCTGHRLWFFIAVIVLPSLVNTVKVITN